MQDGANVSELRSNLTEYQAQLLQVERLLLDDPDNEEYLGIYEGLTQVIKLTEELIAEEEKVVKPEKAAIPVAAISEAPAVQLPSTLPPQVAEQIRLAQQRAALAGQGVKAWAIGAKVDARYSHDGLWYEGTVTGVSASDKFIVAFDASGMKEEIEMQDIRMQLEGKKSSSGYQGVKAPKRHLVSESTDPDTMPKWLELKDTDDEKTKARKRKLIKSFKSKQRFQMMDLAQKEKADAWKSFVQGSKKKRKTQLGLKKESIFATPEDSRGKVGVTGSGKDMTGNEQKRKHDFRFGNY